jgi:hypothetical protein
MTWLIGLFLARGASPKNARAYAWGIVIIAVILLALGLKACYDHSIIANHDTAVEASAAKADRKADQTAVVQEAKDNQRRDQETDQLMKAIQNAPKDPAIPDDRERALAFHRCLRLQQEARQNGLQPPRCV